MAAPVRREIGEGLEAMGNAVIDLLLVRVGLGVALTNALGDDAGITFGVARVLAVLALHASGILEELPAEGATHDVVELALDELVSVHLVHFLLALSNGASSVKTQIKRPAVLVLLDKVEAQLDLPGGFKVEPLVDRLRHDLRLRLWSAIRGALGRAPLGVGRRRELRILRAHGELRRARARVGAHPIRRYPPGGVDLGLDPLPSKLFGDVGYPDPQHPDG